MRVVGIAGAGKSRFSRELAATLQVPHLELDRVFWAENWTFRDVEEARDVVRTFADAHPEGWVADGNWTRLDGLLDPGTEGGAELVVWLDPPRPVVTMRVLRRTVVRSIRRTELWHGNRESLASLLRRDPHANIVLWAWTQHSVVRERMQARLQAGDPIVHLRTPREAAEWLRTVGRGVADRA